MYTEIETKWSIVVKTLNDTLPPPLLAYVDALLVLGSYEMSDVKHLKRSLSIFGMKQSKKTQKSLPNTFSEVGGGAHSAEVGLSHYVPTFL